MCINNNYTGNFLGILPCFLSYYWHWVNVEVLYLYPLSFFLAPLLSSPPQAPLKKQKKKNHKCFNDAFVALNHFQSTFKAFPKYFNLAKSL